MSDSRKVNCGVHGWQEQTFVCQHIAQSLPTNIPVGFHWPSAGGDWTPEVSEKLGAKLLCGGCYDYAKSIWSDGRKITQ